VKHEKRMRLMALAALNAVALTVQAQNAAPVVTKTPAENCFRQTKTQKFATPAEKQNAVRNCLAMWQAERDAKPRPVLIEGRGITPPDP
jgi:hypothetical protein